MVFYKNVLKGSLLYFVIVIFLNIIFDLYEKNQVEIGIADLLTILITALLFSIVMTSLSLRWKKYYDKQKPQK